MSPPSLSDLFLPGASAAPTRKRARFASTTLVLTTAGLASLAGCFTTGEGVPPPLDAFYYPTGLVVSPGGTALYVTNSDFDLQYSGGTVQLLDLPAIRGESKKLRDALNAGDGAEAACPKDGLGKNDNPTLYPGPCSARPLAAFSSQPNLVKRVMEIGAFASGVALAHTQDPCSEGLGARLFVPVRGDPSMTYFDVTDDRRPGVDFSCATPPTLLVAGCGEGTSCLECSAPGNGGRCGGEHLVGRDPDKSQRGLTMPVEPYGMAVSERGDAIAVAHQTTGTVSLVVNRWKDGQTPALEYTLGGLSSGPTDVAAVPVPQIIEEDHRLTEPKMDYTPAFLVSFRASPEVDVLRYEEDTASPPRPFLSLNSVGRISVVASSVDSRGVAVDASERKACEVACPADASHAACLRSCAENIPLGVFMANRAPAALLIGKIETVFTEVSTPSGTEVTGAFERVKFYDSVPLAFGASRVAIGRVVDKDGKLATRVFAAAFDSRFVFSYDPEARRVDAIIRTGRGPHGMAFDSGEETDENNQKKAFSTMYVGHLTDSYVGVVDLDMRNQATFGQMYMTLGQPVPPAGSQ